MLKICGSYYDHNHWNTQEDISGRICDVTGGGEARYHQTPLLKKKKNVLMTAPSFLFFTLTYFWLSVLPAPQLFLDSKVPLSKKPPPRKFGFKVHTSVIKYYNGWAEKQNIAKQKRTDNANKGQTLTAESVERNLVHLVPHPCRREYFN